MVKKYYSIYITRNKINGKIYIGVHSTDDLNDSYLGSGRLLKAAIKKYGKQNFRRRILFVFDNKEDMYRKEREIVNENFIKRKNVYNLRTGGHGSFEHINENGLNLVSNFSDEGKKRFLETVRRNGEYTRDNKLGIHALTVEQHKENGRKGALKRNADSN